MKSVKLGAVFVVFASCIDAFGNFRHSINTSRRVEKILSAKGNGGDEKTWSRPDFLGIMGTSGTLLGPNLGECSCYLIL